MLKQEFEALLRSQLEVAACRADEQLRRPVPRRFGILRGTPKREGRRITVEQAVDELYVSDNAFFAIIDLAVVEVASDTTWVWARESGHTPCASESTWNQPVGAGPFKQLIATEIRVVP